jgi:small-conductance mechanosensitive channel
VKRCLAAGIERVEMSSARRIAPMPEENESNIPSLDVDRGGVTWQRRAFSRAALREYALVFIYAVACIAVLVLGKVSGHVHGSADLTARLIGWCTAGAFLIGGIALTRRLARLFGRVGDRSPIASASVGSGLRIVVTIVGYVVVIAIVLWMLDVSVGRLLVGGALTGVILAVAAQQSLGNVFAGIVLLLARPFTVGDHIRIRSGALGGIFEGDVRGVSLTYVTLETEDGRLMIPNATLLAAAVGVPRGPDAPPVQIVAEEPQPEEDP